MRRVLYDLNVLLDVLLHREPYVSASAAALDAVPRGEAEGYLAGHAVTTLFYILRRNVGAQKARALVAHLLAKVTVAPTTDAGIRRALVGEFGDFEDAVSSASAEDVGAAVIVTRNAKDFSASAIPAVLPEVFLQMEQSLETWR